MTKTKKIWAGLGLLAICGAIAMLIAGPVFLRGFGLSATPGDPTPVGDTIHPDGRHQPRIGPEGF